VDADCRLGVLAFGDSITNGGGELQWGVALQSWAQWTARALGLAFTNYAVDGARVADVVAGQIPAARERNIHSEAHYDLGFLYIGTNDVRALDWDPDAFAADLRIAIDFLVERCARLLVLTLPLDLGRPRAGAAVEVANVAVEAEAERAGATLIDLRGFRGRRVLMPDHVHPTALGQIAIAEKVVDVLGREGFEVFIRPIDLVTYETTRTGRLRGDTTHAYRHAKILIRSARIRFSYWRMRHLH
jgi:lysophospholipase L1-like esterase